MNKQDLRAYYDLEFEDPRIMEIVPGRQNVTWKTHHSLQLTRVGFLFLKNYTKIKNIPLLRIELVNGRNIKELLMIANTMDVPYFISEQHLHNKVVLHTIESDRSTMLILGDGNIINWANMYQTA